VGRGWGKDRSAIDSVSGSRISKRASGLAFLIAKWGIRTSANQRLFSTLHFSNRRKTRIRQDILVPSDQREPRDLSSSLIFRLKIRNHRNQRLFSALRFSNRRSDKASASRGNNVSRGTSLPFLIYTPKIRNRRNSREISHLRISNLYNFRAFFISVPTPPLARHSSFRSRHLNFVPFLATRHSSLATAVLIYGSGIEFGMRRASSSRASNASRGIPPPSRRKPSAKLQRTLIYGTGINFSRKSLKTKDRHHA